MARSYSRQITVFGDLFICHTDECHRYATVIFRTITEGDVESVVLCKKCWMTWRHAFKRAEHDTEVSMRFNGHEYNDGDDEVST